MEERKQIIRDYFDAWIRNDASKLNSYFNSKIRYTECYGPEYHGIEQILRWFSDWHLKGNVLEWQIKEIIKDANNFVVEWYFQCEYEGNIAGFDGVSIIIFNDKNEIISVKEFQSKTEHSYPYE
ncbi:MAG: nuclear transport factor 2 family protein [Mobilitalea sp.]